MTELEQAQLGLEQLGLLEQVLEDYCSCQDHTRLKTHFVSLPTFRRIKAVSSTINRSLRLIIESVYNLTIVSGSRVLTFGQLKTLIT
jgi:hypothetical protein